MPNVKEHRCLGLILVLCGALIFVLFGSSIARSRPLGMLDFKALYYGANCLIDRCDPYSNPELHRYYLAHHGPAPDEPAWMTKVLTQFNNLPTVFPALILIAHLPYPAAQLVWATWIALSLILASLLIWHGTADTAPLLTGALIGLLLANSDITLGGGNAAGIVIGLGSIAVWCFVRDRLNTIGVLCLAIALGIKPHDVGFLWLFFLLSGGAWRKRALQTLAALGILAVATGCWVYAIAPHWVAEFRTTSTTYEMPGGPNSPGISAPNSGVRTYDLPTSPGMISDLRTIVAVFRDDPRVYTPVTWLICAPLFAAWAFAALRLTPTRRNTFLALAAIVPLSLLPVYHRTTDTKLLLLVLPACALLWAERSRLRWPAALLTTAAIVLTGDIPLILIGMSVGPVDWTHASIGRKIALAVITRPVPLILLCLGVFYLCVYIRQLRIQPSTAVAGGLETSLEKA
jgi:hypothetical protein